MRWIDRQRQVEHKTFQAIDDIADEIGLEVPFYPEVYWVGRTLKFDDLRLQKKYERFRLVFHRYKEGKSSFFLGDRDDELNEVLLSMMVFNAYDEEDIGEEAAHFLHYVNAPFSFNFKNYEESAALRIIMEALCYFGSKLICPDRENSHDALRDVVPLDPKKTKKIEKDKRDIETLEDDPEYRQELMVYNQGYGLGERLFNSYVCGETSIDEIREMFLREFRPPYSALAEFLRLKKKYWSN